MSEQKETKNVKNAAEAQVNFVNKMMATPGMNHVTYFAKNKRGEAFKASISAILGEKQQIIGLF